MPVLSPDVCLSDAVRFRDDDPELFGVDLGEQQCDEIYLHGLRDHLCNSVELVPELFPEIARAVEQVQQDLLPAESIRGFISSDPAPQAWCIGGNENRTMILGITSGLIGLMTLDELKFVIGHEIGHYIMGHHRRTPPADGGVDSINFRSLQRMAEISADRIGFLACPRSDASFRAMLKTASGLGEQHLRFDVDAFAAQFQRLRDERGDDRRAGHSAWSTHPLLTVRCRALLRFQDSQPFQQVTGRNFTVREKRMSRAEMDEQIAADMYDSTGYHPVAEIESCVRRDLIFLVLRLFVEDGRFTKSEQAFLRDNFGQEDADRAIEFARAHGPAAVANKYDEALRDLASRNETARSSACAVVRRVASVAGGTEQARLTILHQIHQTLDCPDHPRIEPWADEQTLDGLLDRYGVRAKNVHP